MKFDYIDSGSELLDIINYHNKRGFPIVLDLETTGLNTFTDTIENIVLTGTEIDSAIMTDGGKAPYLSEIRCPLILHNFKFDYLMLARKGIDLPFNFVDTMLLHHLHDENKSHALDSIVQEHWKDNYKEVFWDKYKTYQEASGEDKLVYACKDAVYTQKLFRWLLEDLKQQEVPNSLIDQVHHLAWSLFLTEKEGINIDRGYLDKLGAEMSIEETNLLVEARNLVKVEADAIELAEWRREIDKRKTDAGKARVKRPQFNFGSSKQMLDLLYTRLGLDPVLHFKTKKPTTDDHALKELGDAHPVIPTLRKVRKVQKMLGSFVEGVKDREREGKIFPEFNINGTVSGRISASNPNLQQVPSQGEWKKLRGVFIPREGFRFISCDYSQLEICITAHYSADDKLVKMVKAGESMHDYTAAVTGLTRDQAKKMNFTVLYGGGAWKVASDLGCSVEQAEDYLDELFNAYSGLDEIIMRCHKAVEEGTPIRSVTGRLRHFEKGLKGAPLVRAKRQAFNSLIQGTGADLTHAAAYRTDGILRYRNIGRLLFPVHDEIIIEAKEKHCEEAAELLKLNMVTAGNQLLVPLSVNCSEALQRWEK